MSDSGAQGPKDSSEQQQPRRVLLTGIAGMLGRSLALRLAEAGHNVLGIDIAPPPLEHPNIRAEVADVRDVHRLYRILETAPPIDVIVHGGGISGSMVMRDNPSQVVDINIVGTKNLLEAARLHSIPRFVQCSTIMVYGAVAAAPVMEDRPLTPGNVYGATKVACEALVHSYVNEFGMSAALLRLAHVYGPARTTYCPVRAMVSGALLQEAVVLRDTPTTKRQLIHSDDVVRALEQVIVDRRPGCVTANIGPGAEWSIADLAELVRMHIGPLSVAFADKELNSDYTTAVLSIDRACETWNWRPEIPLSEGILSFAATLKRDPVS